jgi:hypothetical protein
MCLNLIGITACIATFGLCGWIMATCTDKGVTE